MPAAEFTLPVPRGFVLARDACSYGYFLLEPNHWEPGARVLSRVLELPGGGAAELRIEQPQADPGADPCAPSPGNRWRGVSGRALRITADAPLDAPARAAAGEAVARMLRLDEDAAHVRAFHTLDPRWKPTGYGRLFRSPSLFEDVVKTVTSCNVAWPSTVAMNRRLCWHFGQRSPGGGRAFPSASRLARVRPATLRARCGVGYRDARIVELARMFDDGRIDALRLEDPATTDEQARQRLLELPGIGPYAAANILQLLGRYGHLPLDTESVRHGRTVLGMRGPSRKVMQRVGRHFAPFGQQRFRSYWFELWAFYEAKRGPAWTWDKAAVGTSFTAAKL